MLEIPVKPIIDKHITPTNPKYDPLSAIVDTNINPTNIPLHIIDDFNSSI